MSLNLTPLDELRLYVHTKSDCPWCDKAKAFLDGHSLEYTAIVHDDDEERQQFYDRHDIAGTERTMPQIIVVEFGETHRVGGYDKLVVSGVESLRSRRSVKRLAEQRQAQYEAERALIRGEPVFTLRALDKFAVATAEFWIAQALPGLGEDDPKIVSARQRVAQIKQWQEMYGAKHPD